MVRRMTAIALGADHAGYPLKEDLKVWLHTRGYETVDLGSRSSESVDYPDFAAAVALAIISGKAARGVPTPARGAAIEILDTWLSVPFAGGRHVRRVEKLADLERVRSSAAERADAKARWGGSPRRPGPPRG